jgi:hypothetical protein
MGYMTGNTRDTLRTWTAGTSGDVREFYGLPEHDRAEFREHLESLAGRRVLIVSRTFQLSDSPEESETEVIADATPTYVANMLDFWDMRESDDQEHYYRDGDDEYYTSGTRGGSAVPVPVRARYSARLVGFRPRELAAIFYATRRTSPLVR